MESEVPFPHPGEVLLEEFLRPAGVSARKLARHLRVPVRHVEQIIRGERHITAQMDYRLTIAYGQSRGFWLNLQRDYDVSRGE